MTEVNHWRLLTDSKWLTYVHLDGKDVTVTIAKVEGGEVVGEAGRKAKKPVLFFEGHKLPYAASNTSCKTIESLYGPDPRKWAGKKITLFPTTTTMKGGETAGCIRVRPQVPK